MTSSFVDERSGSEKLAELAHEHPELVTIAKVGWVAKGVVYGLVGILAVPIVVDGLSGDSSSSSGSGEEASQSGAIAEVAESPLGAFALWLIGIGLALYVIWRLLTIALPAENDAKTWLARTGYAISAAIYAWLAWSAVSTAAGGSTDARSQNGEGQVDQISRGVMEMTGGRWPIGAVGLAFIAVGAYFVYRGATADFRKDLEPGGVGPLSQDVIVRLGQAGWIGRGVMMLLVGWFVAQAAIQYDPEEANGIDGALRDATSNTLGAVLALVVAVGLMLYGLFCVVSTPRARLTPAG